jgi:uncharacterized membrane protein YphA (DoxX/SURF4 family)
MIKLSMVKKGQKKQKKGTLKKEENKKVLFKEYKIPFGVRVSSVLFAITAVLSILFGVILFLGLILKKTILSSEDIQKFVDWYPSFSFLEIEVGQGLFAAGIIVVSFLIIYGLISFFISKGLVKGNKLSYSFAVVLAVVGLLISLGFFALSYSSLVGIFVHIVLIYFLIIDKETRKFFDIPTNITKIINETKFK